LAGRPIFLDVPAPTAASLVVMTTSEVSDRATPNQAALALDLATWVAIASISAGDRQS
jgi:hypothetical protein